MKGLEGEELTSAVLRMLLLRSHEFREQFVELMSKKSSLGPLSFASHFSCYCEDWTEDEQGKLGRLDIVVEMDDAIVGIENKLSAQFQTDQPQKYLRKLRENAARLGELRSSGDPSKFRYFLAILAPEDRKNAVSQRVDGQTEKDHYVLLWWNEVFELLRSSNQDLIQAMDPKSRLLAASLVE